MEQEKAGTPSHGTYLGISALVLIAVIGLAAGVAGSWVFHYLLPTKEVYVIDVKGIINQKKQELMERYEQNPEKKDELLREADRELAVFLNELERNIYVIAGGKDRLLLLKDVVLGGDVYDVTDHVKKNLGLRVPETKAPSNVKREK